MGFELEQLREAAEKYTYHDPRPSRILPKTVSKSSRSLGRTLEGILQRSFKMNVGASLPVRDRKERIVRTPTVSARSFATKTISPAFNDGALEPILAIAAI